MRLARFPERSLLEKESSTFAESFRACPVMKPLTVQHFALGEFSATGLFPVSNGDKSIGSAFVPRRTPLRGEDHNRIVWATLIRTVATFG